MEKKLRFLLLGCALTLCCGAAPSADPGKNPPKLTPPPIISQWKEKVVQVAETGEFSNISVPESPRSKKTKKAKSKTAPTLPILFQKKGKSSSGNLLRFFQVPSSLLT